ncbi:hypothetical protein A2U01_0030219 [Trifolium medium]|uniref:Secreted protein n=1 Tax=Trifolium medium TaxID=97028 RepID=A0A392PCV0_9FABA|nr:hypothetical protein [Trifolium medium]
MVASSLTPLRWFCLCSIKVVVVVVHDIISYGKDKVASCVFYSNSSGLRSPSLSFCSLCTGGSCCCIALISDSSRSVEICSFLVVGAASVSSSQDPVAVVCSVWFRSSSL